MRKDIPHTHTHTQKEEPGLVILPWDNVDDRRKKLNGTIKRVSYNAELYNWQRRGYTYNYVYAK